MSQPENESCSNCWFVKVGPHGPGAKPPYTCLRFPPQPVMETRRHYLYYARPEVNGDSWCGEWQGEPVT